MALNAAVTLHDNTITEVACPEPSALLLLAIMIAGLAIPLKWARSKAANQ